MNHIQRLPLVSIFASTSVVFLACGVVACNDDSNRDSNGTFGGVTQGNTDETASSGMDTEGDGDPMGDGDPTTTGDGDPTTTGDGDPTTTGDGDPTTTGDGDPTTGDGDPTTTGDGDPTTTGDGDPTTTGDTDVACDEFAVVLEPLPPNVMLVLDKSGSMFTNYWDHDANPNTPQITRWNSLYQVVSNIVTAFDQQIRFGANLFPSVQAQNVIGGAACITSDYPEVPVGPSNGPAILATIPGPNVTMSYGGTPATIGIQTALDHLVSLGPQFPRAMILVTDGAANCSQNAQNTFELFDVYDTALPGLVGSAWTTHGIPTYVVGIDIVNQIINDGPGGDPDNINPYEKLTEVAVLGGTNTLFNSINQGQLQAALDEVVNSVKSCIIPLDIPPGFPNFTKVIIDGMEWPKVNDCATQDGWVYDNPMGPYTAIELCGAACDAVKVSGEAQVEYYCTPG